ncbi:protein of unknown function [Ectopseudomonas oleovorans]|nr:protein of unknown function [Pseudomonas oleovorans]
MAGQRRARPDPPLAAASGRRTTPAADAGLAGLRRALHAKDAAGRPGAGDTGGAKKRFFTESRER